MSCNPFSVAGSHTLMGEGEVRSCLLLQTFLLLCSPHYLLGIAPGVLCKILLWLFLLSTPQPLPPLWAWGVRRS